MNSKREYHIIYSYRVSDCVRFLACCLPILILHGLCLRIQQNTFVNEMFASGHISISWKLRVPGGS